jgi:hypothetical protein
MAETERAREISVRIAPSQPPPPAIAANVCLVNHTGQTFVLDFGFADPLLVVSLPPQGDAVIEATHVGRIVIAQDLAVKLRDQLISILGAS